MTKKTGFTLLEMLISIAIFSGLMILILGVFVRTASSQARVNVVREKSQAARVAINQITTDFQNIYYKPVTLGDPVNNNYQFTGYYFSSDVLHFLIKLPNKSDNELVFKSYSSTAVGGNNSSRSLEVREFRGCRITDDGKLYLTQGPSKCTGSGNAAYRSLLPSGYVLDNRLPLFSGLYPNQDPPRTGFLNIALAVKAEEYVSQLCSALTTGTCYKVQTTLTAGRAF